MPSGRSGGGVVLKGVGPHPRGERAQRLEQQQRMVCKRMS